MIIPKISLLTIACITLTACPSLQTKPNTRIAPLSEVLDLVKDELNVYMNTPFADPKQGACNPDNKALELKPSKVTVTIKAVNTNTNQPSAGLVAPIGVIGFEPTYSGSYSVSNAQTITVALKIDDKVSAINSPNGDHQIAKAIANFRDQLINTDKNKTPCLIFSSKPDEKNALKLSLQFQVVNTSTGGFALKLPIFKIADKHSITNESNQVLDIDFMLPDGTLTTLKDKIPNK